MDIAKHTQRVIYLRDGIISGQEDVKNQLSAEELIKNMPKLEDRI